MKVEVKHPRKIDGHLYSPGIRELKKEHVDHWFTKAQLKDGSFKAIEEAKPSKVEKLKAEEKAEDQDGDEAPADADVEASDDQAEEPKAEKQKSSKASKKEKAA